MGRVEIQKQDSHSSHRPWKSLCDSHISHRLGGGAYTELTAEHALSTVTYVDGLKCNPCPRPYRDTGVGVAVEEMVQQRKPPGLKCMLKPVTITSGQTVSQTSVPRRELMTRLAVEWQEGRVKVAKGLSRWPELRKELLGLDGQGRKKNGRDDLALGLALAVWGLTGVGAAAGERGDGRLF